MWAHFGSVTKVKLVFVLTRVTLLLTWNDFSAVVSSRSSGGRKWWQSFKRTLTLPPAGNVTVAVLGVRVGCRGSGAPGAAAARRRAGRRAGSEDSGEAARLCACGCV